MTYQQSKNWRQMPRLARTFLLGGFALAASTVDAITVNQVDDFQNGTVQNWQGAIGGLLPNTGPAGTGDYSLLLRTSGFGGGVNSRLVVYSGGSSVPAATQWTGNWTAAGVRRISLDVLNPNSFDLNVWLGIAGPDGPGVAGSTDAYVTTYSAIVPPDEQWHTVEFGVLPDDFMSWGSVIDPVAALSDVFQFRILHSPAREWRGAVGEASMLIDNIRVIPEPSACLLAGLSIASIALTRRRTALTRSSGV